LEPVGVFLQKYCYLLAPIITIKPLPFEPISCRWIKAGGLQQAGVFVTLQPLRKEIQKWRLLYHLDHMVELKKGKL